MDPHDVLTPDLQQQQLPPASISQIVTRSTLALLNDIWERATYTATAPKAHVAASWIATELWNPLPQVPVLFTSVGFSNQKDCVQSFDILSNVLLKHLPTTCVMRAGHCSHTRTVETLLAALLSTLRRRGTHQATGRPATPAEFLRCVRSRARSLLIVVDDVDALHTSLLVVLLHLAWKLRSPRDNGAAGAARVPTGLVLGLRVSTIDAVRSTWPPTILTKTLSTGVRIFDLREVLETFQSLLNQDDRLASTVTLPESFCQFAYEEAIQTLYSADAVKKLLETYIATILSLVPFPSAFFLIRLGDKHPETGVEEIVIRIRRKTRGRTSQDSVLCDALQHVYDALLDNAPDSTFPDKDEVVCALVDRFLGRLFQAYVHRLKRSRTEANIRPQNRIEIPPGVEKSIWKALCRDAPLDQVLPDVCRRLLASECAETTALARRLATALKELDDGSQCEVEQLVTVEETLQQIAQRLLTSSLSVVKAHMLPTEFVERAKSLVVQLFNPNPLDAILYTAHPASWTLKQPASGLSLLVQQPLPPWFQDVEVLLGLLRGSSERVQLQQWFVLFASALATGSTAKKVAACRCLECLQERFLKGVQLMIFFGLITEPRKSARTSPWMMQHDSDVANSEDEANDKNQKTTDRHVSAIMNCSANTAVTRLTQSMLYKELGRTTCRSLLV